YAPAGHVGNSLSSTRAPPTDTGRGMWVSSTDQHLGGALWLSWCFTRVYGSRRSPNDHVAAQALRRSEPGGTDAHAGTSHHCRRAIDDRSLSRPGPTPSRTALKHDHVTSQYRVIFSNV